MTPDRYNPVRALKNHYNPKNPKYFTIEAKGLNTGCLFASDETFQEIARAKKLKYWNVADIRIEGHSAAVVFDDEIGKKSTFVFDPWATQSAVYYSWEEWPFESKNCYTVAKIEYCITQKRGLRQR